MRLENDLLCRRSNDDSIAFTELVDNYYVPINSFVLRLTHSELLAQEIVQDLFMKIWINRKSLASVDNLPAYLFVTARNHSLNVLKREALGRKANSIFCSEIIASYQQQEPETYVCRKEILDRFVNRLPSQQRQVYMLCYQNGLKYRDVATLLKISELTVKTHMHHALRAIKTHFKDSAYVASIYIASTHFF